ncbi:Phosphotransferase enzyme family protein [Streptomyces sp. MnatMP-M77]|nr:Phosphotransferase enzyme family protein [Streptomyces sp. MnatMP-M77]
MSVRTDPHSPAHLPPCYRRDHAIGRHGVSRPESQGPQGRGRPGPAGVLPTVRRVLRPCECRRGYRRLQGTLGFVPRQVEHADRQQRDIPSPVRERPMLPNTGAHTRRYPALDLSPAPARRPSTGSAGPRQDPAVPRSAPPFPAPDPTGYANRTPLTDHLWPTWCSATGMCSSAAGVRRTVYAPRRRASGETVCVHAGSDRGRGPQEDGVGLRDARFLDDEQREEDRCQADVIRKPPPPGEGCFLHWDCQPGNVLFDVPPSNPEGVRITGVVDWAPSWGPADRMWRNAPSISRCCTARCGACGSPRRTRRPAGPGRDRERAAVLAGAGRAGRLGRSAVG